MQWCWWDAAHLLPDLFGPTDFDLVLPADDLVQRFLEDVWRRPDPNRPGWLRFDFRPDPERDDEGFRTRFIGDLYQELDAEIRERYALLQTPDFVAEFILENTLCKRFAEKDFREVTLIDPTCGSGHFVVDAFGLFVEQYEAAAGKTRGQLSVSERTHIARQVVEQQLFGCDINPYATALTRFRLTLAACDYARPASLREFRDLRLNIVTIDSLIPYEKLLFGGVPVGENTTRILGQPEDIQRALPVLQRRYDVVVGNPPYIFPQDPAKRDLYRERYPSAHMKFGLAAPFTERFLQLTAEGGQVGLINSNAFARRQFGQKLIEDVLPKYDLQAVIDLCGAFIPGHGTPTVILYIRNQAPSANPVIVVSNLKGEPGTPADASQGRVWQSVVKGYAAGPGWADEYVDIAARSRTLLAQHPWQFGGAKTRLYEQVRRNSGKCVSDIGEVGVILMTNADEVFNVGDDFARRLNLPPSRLKALVVGDSVRDWNISMLQQFVFPYDEHLELIHPASSPTVMRYLGRFRSVLGNRVVFGGETYDEAGRPWYGYHQFAKSRYNTPNFIVFSEIATHNHFVVDASARIFNRTAPVIKLASTNQEDYFAVCSVLNASISCFCLKQLCFNKGTGDDPVRDRYVYAGNFVSLVPIPSSCLNSGSKRAHLVSLAQSMHEVAAQLPTLSARRTFEKDREAYTSWVRSLDSYAAPHPTVPNAFACASELEDARKGESGLRHRIRTRMIFLQEEMDWLAYEMYGLIKNTPLAENFLSATEYEEARLELGQRAFELAGKGYTGDWPKGYKPAPLPNQLRALTDARIAVIKSNPDIAILEDPLYKRRWIPPDYDQEFREAAQWWLAEKLEWTLEQASHPLSLRGWARLLRDDERICATLEVLTGNPNYDLEQELLKVIRLNAVPNRPEHYLKPAGLRKIGIEAAEFASSDFADPVAWRIRGKLNIPRERFIYYAEFDHTLRGAAPGTPETLGPWFGWAGWDAAQRADALAYLLQQAGDAGWEMRWRQCGLRAALRDLVPQLSHLRASDRGEFEAIALQCGIPLGTACYCQAYREGFTRREPGVPGVGEEVLGVKVLEVEEDKPATKRGRKKDENGGGQIPLL